LDLASVCQPTRRKDPRLQHERSVAHPFPRFERARKWIDENKRLQKSCIGSETRRANHPKREAASRLLLRKGLAGGDFC
jgi:hypothetical protein